MCDFIFSFLFLNCHLKEKLQAGRGSKHVNGELFKCKKCDVLRFSCFLKLVCRQIKMDTSNKSVHSFLYSPIPPDGKCHKIKNSHKRILKRKIHFLYTECRANVCDRKKNIPLHSQTHDLDPSFLYNSKLYKSLKHATPFKVPI